MFIVADHRRALNAVVLMRHLAEFACMRDGERLTRQEQGQCELEEPAALRDSRHTAILHEFDWSGQSAIEEVQ